MSKGIVVVVIVIGVIGGDCLMSSFIKEAKLDGLPPSSNLHHDVRVQYDDSRRICYV